METKPYSLQAPEQIAKEYGGNKRAIAQAAQQGLLDPTAAILAGMFIDRMRNAAAVEQGPTQTVAQDVMAPPQPQMGMPSQPPMGLADVPIPENMYEPSYSGGGIVAFQAGGSSRLSPEEIEINRLREQIRRRYAGVTSPLGMFTPVAAGEVGAFQEKRRGLQDLMDALPNLNKEQLVQLDISLREMDQRPIAARQAQETIAAAPVPSSVAAMPDQTQVEVNRLLSANARAQTPAAPPVAPPPPPPKTKPAAVAPAATPTVAAPKEKTFAEFQAEMAAAGINNDVAKKIAELQAKMGDTKAEREEAKNMAILQAGLGIMGGTSPYALQNIAEGAKGALQQYGASMKEIKAAERDADKLGVELAKAEDARKRGDFEAYQKHIDKAKDLEFKLRDLELKGRQVGAQELSARAQMESARRPAGVTTLEAARLRTRADIHAAAQALFALGGDLRKQYNDRVKKDGQEAADRWKQATIRQYVQQQEAMLPELGGSSLGGSSDVTSDPLGLRGGR